MKKLIIFNWKMNPQSSGEARRLLTYNLRLKTNNKKAEFIICPPFVYLSELSSVVGRKSSVKIGAQNCFWEDRGAFTGEISPLMLKNLGVEYVIAGHSERRKYLNETDEMINKKVLAALKSGLKVILCVGEIQRTTNDKRLTTQTRNFVKKQLKKDLKGINKSLVVSRKSLVSNLVIAYEPIWAIGTGNPCHPGDALEMIKFIKSLVVSRWSLAVPVIYGGSVDSKNIKDFVKYKEIDGALVGGASLKQKEVKKIIKSL